jgi:hypothetical protein
MTARRWATKAVSLAGTNSGEHGVDLGLVAGRVGAELRQTGTQPAGCDVASHHPFRQQREPKSPECRRAQRLATIRAERAGDLDLAPGLAPTASSWLNQVERFFALLTERQIRRGVHRTVEELEAAIWAFLDHHNAIRIPMDQIGVRHPCRYCVRATPAA